MHKKTFLAGTTLLLALALLLTACGAPKAPDAPTTDANAVYTQAAATVSAGLTQSAQTNPTETPTPAPPTGTPAAVESNPSPTAAQPGPGDATSTPPAGTAGQATATPAGGVSSVPTATKSAVTAAVTSDKATWVSQSPADKTKIQKSATFTMSYILKNTGQTTWTKGYALRFFAGPMSDPKDTNLLKEVKPGETVEVSFSLVAPDTIGDYTNVWVLSTDQGVNFYTVTLEILTTD